MQSFTNACLFRWVLALVSYLVIVDICLYSGNPQTRILANSENPDVMQHCSAFHQALYCLLRLKQPSGTEIHYDTFT